MSQILSPNAADVQLLELPTNSQPEGVPLQTAQEDRPLKPALLRGWRMRCPNCGAGPMMRGYLTVRESCPVCQQELHHHQADDGPAYLTILIVGHLMAPLMLVIFTKLRPDPLIMSVVFSVGCVALSLWLLPRLKGAIVGMQWAKRMHGFGKVASKAVPKE